VKTLVVRLDHLGDLLLTTPLVRALSVGGHSVDVLVRDSLNQFLEIHTSSKGVSELKKSHRAFQRHGGNCRVGCDDRRYDCIILAYGKEARLCFASAFSGAKAPNRDVVGSMG
jgi:ADP-heptose:LPS heptosyltransferase